MIINGGCGKRPRTRISMQATGYSATRVTLGAFEADVTPLTADGVIQALTPAVDLNETFIVANHNLHSIYLYLTDKKFRDFYDSADLILIDGFPILLAARKNLNNDAAESLTADYRIGSLDWMYRLQEVPGVRKVALVGSSKQSNFAAISRLSELHPEIEYLGLEGDSWNDDRAEEVCAELSVFQPEIVFVGLGMPLQERFIASYTNRLPKVIIATVGGAIDQIGGGQAPAPRWLGRFGLEWVWRLASQPKRLGSRYLVEPWKLLAVLLQRQMDRRGKS